MRLQNGTHFTPYATLGHIRVFLALGSCTVSFGFLDCPTTFILLELLLLNISDMPTQPDPDHWALVFTGRNTVTSLRGEPGAPWQVREVCQMWNKSFSDAVPVGHWQGRALWAFSVSEQDVSPTEHLSGNLYGLLGRVEEPLFQAHGRAYQLLHWLDTHRYCGRCGSTTEFIEGGRSLSCGQCALQVYPRVSPCVIVLVTKGDQLLLAAAAGFQKRFYSTLAGFMEPGETCEDAVRREVREEVGIEVGNVRYFASQPWPFPSQVMLGFFAEWRAGELNPDPEEIEEAGWFEATALPPTPPNASISGQLISHFFESL